MINAGIVGGGGFAAGELIRILLHHPEVQLNYIMSESQVGKQVYETHQDLVGETDLVFTNEFDSTVDVIFLCKGHGQSATFLQDHPVPDSTTIIDLSRDFRLKDQHSFVYGLPELNRADIKTNKRIANPGCFATAIQLALLPLAKKQLLTQDIHLHGITGATGAGQAKLDTTHFSWRNNNVSVYKAFTHQHLTEVNQTIAQCQESYEADINFIPVRGDFTRGILMSCYTDIDLSEDQLKQCYHDAYASEAFTHVSEENIHLKQIVNTNKCLVHVEKHGNKAFIVSAIDNLLKGASGQAVQNMNLHFGFNELAGLNLKAMAY